MTPRHEVVLASAGSGKTWQLTTRFLGLLADEVDPQRVLATTFTRKAAGEIFSRLIERLAGAASDDRELAKLNGALKRPAGEELDRTACTALLARCARTLDRFQVRTLDGCFAELAGVFGLDAGLPPGWEIVEEVEDRALRAEAVGVALAGAPAAELAELLHGLHGDHPYRSVHERVLRAVDDGYGTWLERRDDASWERAIHLPAALPPEELAALPARLEALALPRTGGGKPSVKVADARTALLAAFERQQWRPLLKSRLVGCALDGSGSYSGIALDAGWTEALRAVGQHAIRAEGARLLQRSRSQRALLQRFDTEYRRLKQQRRALRFDDLPRALSRATLDLDGPAAALRLGRRVEHLLLDEFQDTSVLQWRVLAPMARAILRQPAGERSFFCVGDVKQAIYAWREGESRLLRTLADGSCGPVSATPLSESYRSSPVVLALVNRVFEGLSGHPIAADNEVFAHAARRWAEDFPAHRAAAPCAGLPGAARLIEVPMAGDQPGRPERTRQLMAATARHVQALVQQAPGCRVAVLLRRSAPAAPLLYDLAALGIPASGEGGNPLTDSEAVRLALSLLRLASHPGDGAAAFHLATSPLAAALGLAGTARAGEPAVRALAGDVRAALSGRGHGEWLAGFERHVCARPADFDGWERSRFRQLVELGLRWDERSAARTGDFVEHVRLTGVEDPSAARVRVMTVHGAKGLEFDAVVLPDLENDLLGQADGLVALRPDPEGPIESIYPRPPDGLRQRLPELDAGCRSVDERAMEESLCVLYVALTRARRRLDVLVPSHVKGMRTATFACLLRHALLGDEAYPPAGADGVLWTAPGTVERWHPSIAEPDAEPDAAPAPPPAPARLAWSPGAPRTRPLRSPSSLEGGARVAVADLLSLEGVASRGRGVLVHRWLEELQWIEDFAATDDALLAAGQEAARREGLSAADQRSHLTELRTWLTSPVMRAALQQDEARRRLGLATASAGGEAASDITLIVQRERRFAVPDDDGLLVGSMDRVVLAMSGGALLAAEIVDFKTDRVEAGGLDAAVEHYRPQLQAYRRALCALTGLEPARVSCRLLFLGCGEVREV